jgi:hypothetical protein
VPDDPAPDFCKWCGAGEIVGEVGRVPDPVRVAHARSCPLRGPAGQMPPRVPVPAWTDPEVHRGAAGVVRAERLAAPRVPREFLVQRATELRQQGLSWPGIARELGIGQSTAWRLVNENRG